jgi:hypothetical protein
MNALQITVALSFTACFISFTWAMQGGFFTFETQSEFVIRVLDARYGAGNYLVQWFSNNSLRL